MRLQQGDYERQTIFSDDPVEVARRWINTGAQYLHLVDLDGARDGEIVNRDVVARIVQAVDATIELGGGVRDEDTIRELLDLGLDRLVIGTRALQEPDWMKRMCQQFPGKLVLGIDAKNGYVATHGWLETSSVLATQLASQFEDQPLAAIIYTDIATDGMLAGPNLAAMAEMQRAIDLPVIASGGVTTLQDIRQLADIPMAGAVVGRAIYEGRLDLAEAIAASDHK